MSNRIDARAFALVSVLLSILVLVGSAAAQVRVEENVNLVVTGEITALDPAARTLSVESTNDDGLAYQVDPAATIMSGGQKLELGDLKTGWSVVMNGHRVGETRRVTMIKVVKAP